MWVLSADVVVSQTQTPEQMSYTGDPLRQPLRYPYRTRDGRFIQLMFLDPDRYWEPLCRLVGREDLLQDARFDTSAGRIEYGPALVEQLQATIGARDWADWRPSFEAWDSPWELVRTIHEVALDTQAEANGYTFEVEVTDGSKVMLASGPVGFNGHHAPAYPRRAPLLGEHSDEILGDIGVSGEELAGLRARSAVQ
jgi:crotonobetainyl-CoA:carnitine CoA-transferase CaiB-like acyl-CoA transferase